MTNQRIEVITSVERRRRWSFAGPSLLAMILIGKYANHQPLNRQSEHYAREGIDLSVSTMADHVGACAASLMPLYELIKAHVFAAGRIHGDDTTVPVLARVKTRTGRIWTYVRDDRPFGGRDPPAAVFFYSPDRGGLHLERHLAFYAGMLQADAYAGFNALYEPDRKMSPRKREARARPRCRPWRWPRCKGSMRSSRRSGRSMESRRMRGLRRGARTSRRW